MKNILLVFLLNFQVFAFAQSHEDCFFCQAVRKGDFRSVERQFKWEVKLRKHGTLINNTYYVHNTQVQELVDWLSSHPVVIEATQEKCACHISIYPGWTYVGARFQTNKGIEEKSFHIQLGKILRFNSYIRMIPCTNHLNIKLSKDVMVYKKMHDSPGFCEQQKLNCKLMLEQDSISRIEFLKFLSITADTCHLRMKVINNEGGYFKSPYGINHYNFIAVTENSRPDKGFIKGDTIGLIMNLSAENKQFMQNWTDPRPPLGWELVNPGNEYICILNRTIEPLPIAEKKIIGYYLYGGADCVRLP
ncbi:MAG: hypothetical protein AB9842_05795 [Bacteroidales bacterium]